jgi:hypothetical protein
MTRFGRAVNRPRDCLRDHRRAIRHHRCYAKRYHRHRAIRRPNYGWARSNSCSAANKNGTVRTDRRSLAAQNSPWAIATARKTSAAADYTNASCRDCYSNGRDGCLSRPNGGSPSSRNCRCLNQPMPDGQNGSCFPNSSQIRRGHGRDQSCCLAQPSCANFRCWSGRDCQRQSRKARSADATAADHLTSAWANLKRCPVCFVQRADGCDLPQRWSAQRGPWPAHC